MTDYIFAYFCVALVGVLIAVAELLSRYGMGNNPAWILLGKPQALYYLVNALAGIVALFFSETLGYSDVIATLSKEPALGVIMALKVGAISMLALRSSIYSVQRKGSSERFDLGPAQILNIMNRYLDRQLDQNRGDQALDEVHKILGDFDLSLMELSTICLAVPEAIPKEDLERLRKTLDALRSSKSVSQSVRAITMGIEIQKEVGTNTLRKAVAILRERSLKSEISQEPKGIEKTELEDVEDPVDLQLDKELDAKLSLLSQDQAPATDKPRSNNDDNKH